MPWADQLEDVGLPFSLLEMLLIVFTGAVLIGSGIFMYDNAKKSAARVDQAKPRTAEQVRLAFEEHEMSGLRRQGGAPFVLTAGVLSVKADAQTPLVEVDSEIVCEFPPAARSQIKAIAPGSILNARCLVVGRVGKKVHLSCKLPGRK